MWDYGCTSSLAIICRCPELSLELLLNKVSWTVYLLRMCQLLISVIYSCSEWGLLSDTTCISSISVLYQASVPGDRCFCQMRAHTREGWAVGAHTRCCFELHLPPPLMVGVVH